MKSRKKNTVDGPANEAFAPLPIDRSKTAIPDDSSFSDELLEAFEAAPVGDSVCWGIPFSIPGAVLVGADPVTIDINTTAKWLVIMHTVDKITPEINEYGFISPARGNGALGVDAGRYTFVYEGGEERTVKIRRRHQISAFRRQWGENCFEAVAHHKPHSFHAHHEQVHRSWGRSQTRASSADMASWINWLWAWENPLPDVEIRKIRLVADGSPILLFALSAGDVTDNPLRWERRSKCLFHLNIDFDPEVSENGLYSQINLDMGQIISAERQTRYDPESWESGYVNQVPEVAEDAVLIEYTAHGAASFHLENGTRIPVASIVQNGSNGIDSKIEMIPAAHRRVKLRVLERGSTIPVPVKLHIHGVTGEYLPPVDRHRVPNDAWFEDYSVDFIHAGSHKCSYIPGETLIDLPLGKVYIEISKGFEISPIRRMVEVREASDQIDIEIDRVLDWRSKGWVTADTHVHFLSPMSALLEGSAEGVNVVNLLASQWGELQTNVGDFDGKNTWGSKDTGGDGEYLVRVGTENRQHVMGHISLLGYDGNIIAPMTTGGPDESAIGDPIEVLLTEWAKQCHDKGGLVIIPHFPNPRNENAATIVSGEADGIEMTSWGDHFSGINPYSLSDWYRYLNCGYQVAAVGGTDKMSAGTAIGTVRTYARIDQSAQFEYSSWMDAVRRGETFVSYGPLVDFSVDGKPAGSSIRLAKTGGTVEVVWEVASVTVPMSRIDLVVNGEIRESLEIAPDRAAGSWSVPIERSSWVAILVRGHYAGKPEIIAAHTSTVQIGVEGSEFSSAADEVTILEQIEGAMAYLDVIGTRAETVRYKQMRLVLEAAHREVHNRMHTTGHFHEHTQAADHEEHRG